MTFDPNKPQPAEPLLTVGFITAAAGAVLTLAVAFGLKLNHDQLIAIVGVIAVAAPIAVALLARGRVFAPDTVAEMVEDAKRTAREPSANRPQQIREP